jgi:hypothetical protein
LILSHRIKLTLYARKAPPKVGFAIMSIENNKYSRVNFIGERAMTDGKGNKSERLSIGTISILRTLVELDQAGAVDIPIDKFVVGQREQGDNRVANAIDAIRGRGGSVRATPKRN